MESQTSELYLPVLLRQKTAGKFYYRHSWQFSHYVLKFSSNYRIIDPPKDLLLMKY